MQLALSTWHEVEEYLRGSRGIIIPIGSTEQHGPTGLIGTDALTAEMIGRGVGEKVGALVAPTISTPNSSPKASATRSTASSRRRSPSACRSITSASPARSRYAHRR